MKRLYGAVAAAVLLSASGALAVAKGGSLYIKSKDVKLLKDPKAGATALKPLDIGTEVKWLGASEKDKAFHEVEAGGKKGFVLMSNLSPSKPQMEIAGSSGAAMSPQAFASSGAATKALTPAGINYAKGEGKDAPKALEAAAEIIHVEEYNKTKGTPEAIAAKSKSLGGGK
ncbi:MAG: hypothetical protein Q8N26_35295 [Myxococcales bacterium]|nr:hypothetical protein [Myxococcales bacterium]